jgi:hypothetical protein
MNIKLRIKKLEFHKGVRRNEFGVQTFDFKFMISSKAALINGEAVYTCFEEMGPFFLSSQRRNHNILKEKSAYGKNWTRKRGRKSEI